MEQDKKKAKIWQIVVQVVVILAIGSGSVWIASLFSKEKNTPPSVVVGCPLDTNAYQMTRASKNVVLLADKNSYAINGSFTGRNYNVVVKRTGLNSKIACGYLFYRVSDGSKPIEQKYENLRMIPTDSKQFGGQILPDEKSAISNNNVGNKTEIIVPLNAIPYDGIERVNIKQVDWVSLLNVADQMSFDIALNTINPLGHIDSVEIAYKCWNPQTGEETNDCSLEVAQ